MILTDPQRAYLKLAKGQPGGKLPLFFPNGKRINPRTIRGCIKRGLCEPWCSNPVKPEWIVCRITEAGKEAINA